MTRFRFNSMLQSRLLSSSSILSIPCSWTWAQIWVMTWKLSITSRYFAKSQLSTVFLINSTCWSRNCMFIGQGEDKQKDSAQSCRHHWSRDGWVSILLHRLIICIALSAANHATSPDSSFFSVAMSRNSASITKSSCAVLSQVLTHLNCTVVACNKPLLGLARKDSPYWPGKFLLLSSPVFPSVSAHHTLSVCFLLSFALRSLVADPSPTRIAFVCTAP